MSIVRIVDDQDPAVAYDGDWEFLANIPDTRTVDSTLTCSSQPSASVVYKFAGEQWQLYLLYANGLQELED